MHPIEFSTAQRIVSIASLFEYLGFPLLFNSFIFYMFRLGNTTLRGRNLQEARSWFSGLFHIIIESLPEDYLSKVPHTIFKVLFFYNNLLLTLFHYPSSIIYRTNLLASCDQLCYDLQSYDPSWKAGRRLRSAASPSPLRSFYPPAFNTHKIISCESTMPRYSSPWSAQEGRIWRSPSKAAARLFNGRP